MSRCFRHGRDSGLDSRLMTFLKLCEERLDFDTMLVWGGRTRKQQLAMYAVGRTVPGPNVSTSRPMGDVVTYAKDIEDTAHGRFGAADLVPLCHGRPDWNDRDKFYEIGQLAESMDLEWGGRFTKKKRLTNGTTVEVPFFDGGHVQTKDWRSLPLPPEDKPEVA